VGTQIFNPMKLEIWLSVKYFGFPKKQAFSILTLFQQGNQRKRRGIRSISDKER
jgi:hypothetical protein